MDAIRAAAAVLQLYFELLLRDGLQAWKAWPPWPMDCADVQQQFGPVDLRRSFSRGRERCANGFTLLKLLVVVAIIALLAAYIGPDYFA